MNRSMMIYSARLMSFRPREGCEMNRQKSTKNITISIEIKSNRQLKNAMILLDKPLMNDYNIFAIHFMIILAQLSNHVNYKNVRTSRFFHFFPCQKT